MKSAYLFAAILLAAAPTLHAGEAPVEMTVPAGALTPMDAIFQSASVAPRGVRASFVMEVKAIGTHEGTSYLDSNAITYVNSEEDYRDQRCLTLALPPQVRERLELRLGGPLDKTLKGKRVLVKGVAQRVEIRLYGTDGQATGKYYYQTHIRILNEDQIKVI